MRDFELESPYDQTYRLKLIYLFFIDIIYLKKKNRQITVQLRQVLFQVSRPLDAGSTYITLSNALLFGRVSTAQEHEARSTGIGD